MNNKILNSINIIASEINLKNKKDVKKKNKELKMLQKYISKSKIFNGSKKKSYNIIKKYYD